MGLRNFGLALLTVLISLLGQGVVKAGLNQTRAAASEGSTFFSIALSAAMNPLLWAGVAIMGVGAFCYFTLLYFTDFTRALPIMGAIGYILIPLYGRFFLHETFNMNQWVGLGLLIGGIYMLSR